MRSFWRFTWKRAMGIAADRKDAEDRDRDDELDQREAGFPAPPRLLSVVQDQLHSFTTSTAAH